MKNAPISARLTSDIRQSLARWLILALSLSVIAAILGYKTRAAYVVTEQTEHDRLLSQARVIGTNLDEKLRATYYTLDNLRYDAPLWKTGNSALASARASALVSGLRGVRTVNLLNRDGVTLASNRAELVGKNFSEREYFQRAKVSADFDTAVLSPPFKTALGVWGMNLALAVPGAHGEFAGLVTATLDQAYFNTLLSSVNYAPDTRTALAHGDGMLFAMMPSQPGAEGKSLTQPGSFFTQHLLSGRAESVVSGATDVSGELRMLALLNVQAEHTDRPLIIAVTRDLEAVFSHWKYSALIDGVFFLALTAFSVIGLALYQRRSATNERALREHERLLAETQSIAHIGTWAVHVATGRVTWSDETYRIYGLTRATFAHDLAAFKSLIHPDDRGAMQSWIQCCLAANEAPELVFRAVLPNGDVRVLSGHGVRRCDAAGKPIEMIGSVQDITLLKNAEAEREQLSKQLLQMQKMEAIGQLTGGIAHDFNNILASMLGYTELTRERLPQNGDAKLVKYLDQIQLSGERARDLIAKMMAFARGTRTTHRIVNPRVALRDILHMVTPTFPSSIQIAIEIDTEPLSICIDATQLHQVVVNLLINARDALPGHGNIRVALCRAGTHNATCDSCGKLVTGEYVTLVVSDDGSGIAPELLPRIFDPFYTNKDVGKGTGLGLSVVHGVVHEVGGHVLVSSTVGSGTTFRVLFPYVTAALTDPPAAPPTEETPQ